MIKAVEGNNIHIVQALISEGSAVNDVDQSGQTALFIAVWKGHVECVVALLEANADVNKANGDGYTPLHRASISGRADCMRVIDFAL